MQYIYIYIYVSMYARGARRHILNEGWHILCLAPTPMVTHDNPKWLMLDKKYKMNRNRPTSYYCSNTLEQFRQWKKAQEIMQVGHSFLSFPLLLII